MTNDTACPECRREIERRRPELERQAAEGLAPGRPAGLPPPMNVPVAADLLLPRPAVVPVVAPPPAETKPSGGSEGETMSKRGELPEGYTPAGPIERLAGEDDEAYGKRQGRIYYYRRKGGKPAANGTGGGSRKAAAARPRAEPPATEVLQEDPVRVRLLMASFLDSAGGQAAIQGLETEDTRPDAAIAIFAAGVRAGKEADRGAE